jgi:hypothetical protein
MAVELFFVMAGLNLTRTLDRYDGVVSYTRDRARRLAPEVGVVWALVLICVLAGWKSPGLVAFLVSAPLFLQNFAEPFFPPDAYVSWIGLLSLWFVAALMQLSVFLFLVRKAILRRGAAFLLLGSLALGLLFRVVLVEALGGFQRNLSHDTADTLYRMPFTHIEAMILGVLLGRGLLSGIGRYIPLFALTILGAGLANAMLGQGSVTLGSLGFPIGMAFNYQYLWGYPLLALAAASVCAPDGPFATAIDKLSMPARMEALVSAWSRLTYGAYVFHGLILAAIWNAMRQMGLPLGKLELAAAFLATTLGGFAAAAVFQRLREGALVPRPETALVPRAEEMANRRLSLLRGYASTLRRASHEKSGAFAYLQGLALPRPRGSTRSSRGVTKPTASV